MRTPWYAAATFAVLTGSSSWASAQDDGNESGWFEAESEPEPAEAEAEAEPQAPPKPPARSEPASKPTPTPAAHHAGDHEGCRWHHRGPKPAGSRSLSLVLGKGRYNAPELAGALERAGFDHDGSELRLIGLQGTRVTRGKLVLGLGGTYGWSERLEREDGAGGRMTLMQLRGQVGYALVHTDKWLLYPALEIAGSHLEIDLGAPGAASFDDALAEPRTGTELTKNSLSAGGVVAIERRFPLRRWKRRDQTRFFSVGLRAGFLRDVVASPWRVDGDGDARGPEEHATLGYIGLTVGFGTASF
jgi:hypothetical protein